MVRNMRSIGLDLQPWLRQGLLHFHASRPTVHGLEMHLATMHRLVQQVQPTLVIIDPISNLVLAGAQGETGAMVLRLLDFLKGQNITAVFTNLTGGNSALEMTELGISSLVDTWMLLRAIESNGERNRGLYVLKSRGMAHSNQIREFVLSDRGIELKDIYVGLDGMLTGSARLAREASEQAAAVQRRQAIERKKRNLERKRRALEARVAALRLQFEAEEEDMDRGIRQEEAREEQVLRNRQEMAHSRQADAPPSPTPGACP